LLQMYNFTTLQLYKFYNATIVYILQCYNCIDLHNATIVSIYNFLICRFRTTTEQTPALVLITDQTLCPYPTRSLPAQEPILRSRVTTPQCHG
jgi:hypothetical protein